MIRLVIRVAVTGIFFLRTVNFLHAQSDTTGILERSVPNEAFQVGERIELTIGYEFIPAGKAVMSVVEIVEMEGREVYHITSETKSNRFFDPFFKVRDRIDTFIDRRGLYSHKFTKQLREGSYSYDYSVDFDHEARLARSVSPAKRDTVEIPAFTQDILSALYYLRTLDIVPGEVVSVMVLDNDKLYPLNLNVLGRERVDTPMGTFDCLVIEPLLKGGGLFKYEGRVTVWVTDDKRKIPVLMKAKALIGSIVAKLTAIEGVIE